jgi:hypothetical protein
VTLIREVPLRFNEIPILALTIQIVSSSTEAIIGTIIVPPLEVDSNDSPIEITNDPLPSIITRVTIYTPRDVSRDPMDHFTYIGSNILWDGLVDRSSEDCHSCRTMKVSTLLNYYLVSYHGHED